VSQAQLLSLIGVLFALLATLVGVIFHELRKRIGQLESENNSAVLLARLDATTVEIAKLEARFEQRSKLKDEADRDFRHTRYASDVSMINMKLWPLDQKVEDMEKRLDGLHAWKHVVGEAYLPRAVDDIERRVGKLEGKVFNGHGAPR
jgi:hypothetical protein